MNAASMSRKTIGAYVRLYLENRQKREFRGKGLMSGFSTLRTLPSHTLSFVLLKGILSIVHSSISSIINSDKCQVYECLLRNLRPDAVALIGTI